jgi:beta-lactamase regulating signal transducer with metallopeptidase domain
MNFVGVWKAGALMISATVFSDVISSELLVSFALTLAMHSTIVLGCAWLLNKVWHGASDVHREYLWRGALIAAFLGPVLQFALHAEPAAGHVLTLERAVAVPAPDVTSPTARTESTEVLVDATPVQPQPDTPIETSHSPIAFGAIAFALLGILAAGTHLRARHRLFRTIGTRVAVRNPAIHAIVLRLAGQAGYRRSVRLTQCEGLDTAIAFGVLRPEICLPARFECDLDAPMLEAMIAHELAHLIRRDPVWMALTGWISTLLFWQPLLRVARKNLIDLAELRADQIAADLAGRVPLARCLVEVAGWLTQRRPSAAAAFCGMAVRQNVLAERVDRLLEERRPSRELGWLAGTGAILLLATGIAFGQPGVDYGAATPPVEAENTDATIPETFQRLDAECDALVLELRRLARERSTPDDAALVAEIERQIQRVNQNRSRIRAALALQKTNETR